MSQRTQFGFAKSTLYSILTLAVGAICFVAGYMSGWSDRGVKVEPVQEALKAARGNDIPHVKPTQGEAVYLPKDHPPLPLVDQHGHPSFDCRDVQRFLPKEDKEITLKSLFEERVSRAGQTMNIKAVVVGVYPNILNLNWYHLCDAPSGQVLVVSSEQQAPIGSVVTVKGELKVDYDLKGIYRFPLFISNALINGDGVRTPPKAPPTGVIKL